jgi:hypothetical protein
VRALQRALRDPGHIGLRRGFTVTRQEMGEASSEVLKQGTKREKRRNALAAQEARRGVYRVQMHVDEGEQIT